MTFTVTSVKHYARSVDANNNLVIKTTIQGSISGLCFALSDFDYLPD